jgi:hypothetical protein
MIYLDDQPATELAGATVTFSSPQLHKSASAEIQPNGTYRLESVPGKYQVSVSPPESAGLSERGSRPPVAKPIVFETPKNLEVTIETKTNDIPIHLHRGGMPRR